MSTIRHRLTGHRLIRSTSGVADSYQQGRCECGQWRYTGWTEDRTAVTVAHQNHVQEQRAQRLPAFKVVLHFKAYSLDIVVYATNAVAAVRLAYCEWRGRSGAADVVASGGQEFIIRRVLGDIRATVEPQQQA